MSAVDTAALDAARQLADTVMYEGYVLFPYRASALKNRFRWQWGVVIPQAQAELGDTEPSEVVTEVLVRTTAATALEVTARFLHLELRQMHDAEGRPVEELEVDGVAVPTWEEGHEGEVTTGTRPLVELAELTLPLDVSGSHRTEAAGTGHAERTAEPLTGTLDVTTERLADDVVRLRVRVANTTDWSAWRAPREQVVRRSLVGVHVLLAAHDGTFASAIDPPDWAEPHAAECQSRHLHPVLVGDEGGADDVVLAAPIILYDHAELAPESSGPSFDALEMDELIALCVTGLSDEEKAAARATDPRAAELLARTEALPAAALQRLHGRNSGGAPYADPALMRPEAEANLDPALALTLGVGETPIEEVALDGRTITVGGHVRLRPRRRADAHDLFSDGRIALVEKIVRTDEGDTQLAVTLVDDPAAELHRWYGRFQYFGLDEVETLTD